MADDINEAIVEPFVLPNEIPPEEEVPEAQRVCPACGGTDHLRRTSKKCPHYVPRVPRAMQNDGSKNDTATSIEPTSNENNEISTSITDKDSTKSNKDNVGTSSNSTVVDTEDKDLDISCPKFIKLESTTSVQYKPVIDVSHKDFQINGTVFKLYEKDYRGRNKEVQAKPNALLEKFFTEEFMMKFVDSSNNYIDARKNDQPDLYCWKDRKVSGHFTLSDMYHFFAILYYFGIALMPSKSDYWTTKEWMPEHKIVHEFGMTRRRFEFIWRHFHPSFDQSDNNEVEEDIEDTDVIEESTSLEEDANDEDGVLESSTHTHIERIQVDQEVLLAENSTDEQWNNEEEIQDEDTRTQQSSEKKVWYDKLTWVINHIRDVSQDFIFVLGTILSLDEMMIRFFGRSKETHRMKNKPIKEGYKFFVLTTKEGFILNFTPDGRTAAKVGEQEYNDHKGIGKVESMISFLIEIIDKLKERQLTRLRGMTKKTSTRGNSEALFEDTLMKDFCLAMDNYFTFPKVIHALRQAGIGIVGTARFRGKSWPPKELRVITKEKCNFNDFYWTVDEFGTMCARWMDNGLVFCVSTLHKNGYDIKRNRKRPRVTQNNRNHVKDIWGDKGAAEIKIPTLIDDYNHWMGGVDVADQRISYYHPSKLVCLRNWIPIFLQLLSIIRNNAYIIHRSNMKKDALTHKEFTQEIVSWLMSQANDTAIASSRRTIKPKVPEAKTTSNRKRKKVASTVSAVQQLSERFPSRITTPKELHARSHIGRGTCVYCSAQYADEKKKGKKVCFEKDTKRTYLHCSFCTLTSKDKSTSFLCKEHFDVFHYFP